MKVFSIEEANALIPELETLLESLNGKKQACDKLHDMLFMDELLKDAETKGNLSPVFNRLEEEVERLEGSILEIQNEIKKIRSLGCIPRSLKRGRIDFPAEKDGEAVYFCWQRGEKSIQFYSTDSVKGERLPIVQNA